MTKILVALLPLILQILIGKGDAQCNTPHTNVFDNCLTEVENDPLCSAARIFGGVDASNSQFPYLVSLQAQLGNRVPVWKGYYRHICTATMIADRVALTAAHCIWIAGTVDMRVNSAEFEGELKTDYYAAIGPFCRHMQGLGRFKVVRYYIHPEYQGVPESGNDIAILVLDEGFNYNEKLADYKGAATADLQSVGLVAVGWGAVSSDEKDAQIFLENVRPLQVANLNQEPAETCSQTVLSAGQGFAVNASTMLCAFNDVADTCQGDSGGPLLVTGKNGAMDIQVGITSWGLDSACDGLNGLPGLYTNVAYYINWIDSVLEQISGLFPELKVPIEEVLSGTFVPKSSVDGLLEESISGGNQTLGTDGDIDPDCLLEMDYGTGEGFFPSYYFSALTGQCVEFAWTGLRFNANNFASRQECEQKCPPQDFSFTRIGLNRS